MSIEIVGVGQRCRGDVGVMSAVVVVHPEETGT